VIVLDLVVEDLSERALLVKLTGVDAGLAIIATFPLKIS
jgi:hypothetical protein